MSEYAIIMYNKSWYQPWSKSPIMYTTKYTERMLLTDAIHYHIAPEIELLSLQ